MDRLVYTAVDSAEEYAAHPAVAEAFFPLHRSLRPHFEAFDAYFAQMQRVLADHARLLLVYDAEGRPVGLALYRIHHNTYQHKLFFLEDLVVDEARRGEQFGTRILRHCEDLARQEGCRHVSLDSGVFRPRAHKFYFLHDYFAESFHFCKKL